MTGPAPSRAVNLTMAEELSYVLITPYSIRKSRTGGILSRLLSRSGLDLVAGRMFAISPELAQEFADATVTETDARHRRTQELIRDYILKKLSPDADGVRQRVLLLVLKGDDAVLKTRTVTGHIVHERTSGETIRDTYGDYLVEDGELVYFEPAVLAAPDEETARKHLEIFKKYSDTDGGVLDESIPFPAGENVEKTLVLIKPDNFRFPNARPGGVMDLFPHRPLHYRLQGAPHERRPGGGLLLVRCWMCSWTDFGEPSASAPAWRSRRNSACRFPRRPSRRRRGKLLGPVVGSNHRESIVQFMAGARPSQVPADRK